MTTVPKAGDPAPANNAKTLTVSDAMSGNYGRPASGGAPVAGKQEGNAPASVAPGVIPNSATAYSPPPPAPVTAASTQAGADVGSGTTIIAGQPDATGHPIGDISGGGTVGDSGNQGDTGAPSTIRTDFPKSSDLP